MHESKTVALFEDLSGIGRCALSVAIPIISAMGSQACAIPTALLSAHTGFGNVVPLDMTEYVKTAISEWGEMAREFDCVLSGYMPSPDCVDAVAPFMASQKRLGHVAIADPAMADDGRLYRSLDPRIVKSYRNLARHATIITPNETEARLLTGKSATLDDTMDALLALGCETAIITGWTLNDNLSANACKTRGGKLETCEYRPLPARFPGTGDILAACIAGYVNNGLGVFEALERATAFVRNAMEATMAAKTDPKDGVLFERALNLL